MSNKYVSQTKYEKGQVVAATSRIRKILPQTTSAQLWKVQSQSHNEIEYNVIFNHDEFTCDCKDFELHEGREMCKHCYAVVIWEIS